MAKSQAEYELSIKSQIAKLDQESAERYQKYLMGLQQGNATLDEFRGLWEDINSELDNVSNDLDYINNSFKATVAELSSANYLISQQKKGLDGLANVAREVLSVRQGEVLLDGKKAANLKEQYDKYLQILKTTRDQLIAIGATTPEQQKQLEYLNQQIKDSDKVRQGFEKVLEVDKEINKQLGFLPNVVGGVDKALQKLGLPELGFKDALDKTKMMGQEAKAAGNPFNAIANFTKNLVVNISEAVTFANLLTLGIGAAVVALVEADKHTGELAKNMGVSYREATEFHHEMTGMANTSDYLVVTTNDLINAQMKLSDVIGTANNLSKDLLDDFAGLTEQAGYSEEAMMGLGMIVASTGADLSDTTSEMLGQVELMNQQNGLSVNSKQLVEEISKVSSATALTYGLQGKKLGEAAFQAKQVGINLEQAASIANNLLNFEDSISAELEAELLTGKDLNLEKARQLALEGDIAGAAKAALENIKSAAEFTSMNVVQQEALARAAGVTREDLAKSLMEREALARLGKQEGDIQKEYNKLVEQGLSQEQIAKKLGDEKLASQLQSTSANEKFAATFDKLKEVFTSLVTPLLPVLQVVGDIVSAFSPLFKMIGQVVKFTVEWGKYLLPIYGIYKGIQIASKVQLGIQQAQLMLRIRAKGTEQAIGMQKRLQTLADKGSVAQKFAYNALLTKQMVHEKMSNLQKKIANGLEATWNSIKQRGILLTLKDIALAGVKKAKQLGGFLIDVGRFAVTAARSIASIPIIGPVLAIGAAAAAVAGGMALYNRFKGDDVVSPGYGKRTLLAGKDAIDLNDEDDVVAGTDLFGSKKKKSSPQSEGGPSVDLTPLINEMANMRSVMEQILMKETNIYLDSTKVGTGFAMASSKVQ